MGLNMDVFFTLIQNVGDFILYKILIFVLVLGIMVLIHELGHFLIAKAFNVKVLKFALGFGPKIIARDFGETEYSIRYFPLGGFVKMLGEGEFDEEADELPPEDELRAFNNQHALKRMAIIAAGPVFNLGLAVFLFFGIFFFSGKDVITAEVGGFSEVSPAKEAGMIEGDIILSIQGQPISCWDDLKGLIQDSKNIPKHFIVQRGDQQIEMNITPREQDTQNIFGEEIRSAQIGIISAQKITTLEIGLLQAIDQSISETKKYIVLTCLVVVKLFQGVVPFKTVGGPIMIADMTGEIAKHSFMSLFPFMAIISINLGILNLLPIPILDGGLILFLLLESFMGRPFSLKTQEWAMKIGLSLLVFLMIFVFYNDILRYFQ
jgi:regulator of sigma E protease